MKNIRSWRAIVLVCVLSMGLAVGSETEKGKPFSVAARQVNAKDHGAVGDGTADDTTAIKAALNAAATKGPVCYLPAGHRILVESDDKSYTSSAETWCLSENQKNNG